jgi:hypothetical protein
MTKVNGFILLGILAGFGVRSAVCAGDSPNAADGLPDAMGQGAVSRTDDTRSTAQQRRGPNVVPSVEELIQTILGVSPTRSELVYIFRGLGLGELTREEKRVRGKLVDRMESRKDAILPYLATAEGMRQLTRLYIQACQQSKGAVASVGAARAVADVPTVEQTPYPMSIAAYLNKK